MSDERILQQIYDRVTKGQILTEVEEQLLLKSYMKAISQLRESNSRLMEVLAFEAFESDQINLHTVDIESVVMNNRKVLAEAPKNVQWPWCD